MFITGGQLRSCSPSMAHIESHSHIKGMFIRKEGVVISSPACLCPAQSAAAAVQLHIQLSSRAAGCFLDYGGLREIALPCEAN